MKYRLTYFLLLFLLISCSEDEPDPKDMISSILMSKGWILDKYVFYFNDDRDQLEVDRLILKRFQSDTTYDTTKYIYNNSWLVFDSINSVRTLITYDLFSKFEDDEEWVLAERNHPVERTSEWGFDNNDALYINMNFSGGLKFRRIEILNEDNFIIEDAIIVEDTFKTENIVTFFIYGDYPSGVLQRIDKVYKAAVEDEGPGWWDPWIW